MTPKIANTDDICPNNNGKPHVPAWLNISVEWDGDEEYIDVQCLYCDRAGTLGTSHKLAADATWEPPCQH